MTSVIGVGVGAQKVAFRPPLSALPGAAAVWSISDAENGGLVFDIGEGAGPPDYATSLEVVYEIFGDATTYVARRPDVGDAVAQFHVSAAGHALTGSVIVRCAYRADGVIVESTWSPLTSLTVTNVAPAQSSTISFVGQSVTLDGTYPYMRLRDGSVVVIAPSGCKVTAKTPDYGDIERQDNPGTFYTGNRATLKSQLVMSRQDSGGFAGHGFGTIHDVLSPATHDPNRTYELGVDTIAPGDMLCLARHEWNPDNGADNREPLRNFAVLWVLAEQPPTRITRPTYFGNAPGLPVFHEGRVGKATPNVDFGDELPSESGTYGVVAQTERFMRYPPGMFMPDADSAESGFAWAQGAVYHRTIQQQMAAAVLIITGSGFSAALREDVRWCFIQRVLDIYGALRSAEAQGFRAPYWWSAFFHIAGHLLDSAEIRNIDKASWNSDRDYYAKPNGGPDDVPKMVMFADRKADTRSEVRDFVGGLREDLSTDGEVWAGTVRQRLVNLGTLDTAEAAVLADLGVLEKALANFSAAEITAIDDATRGKDAGQVDGEQPGFYVVPADRFFNGARATYTQSAGTDGLSMVLDYRFGTDYFSGTNRTTAWTNAVGLIKVNKYIGQHTPGAAVCALLLKIFGLDHYHPVGEAFFEAGRTFALFPHSLAVKWGLPTYDNGYRHGRTISVGGDSEVVLYDFFANLGVGGAFERDRFFGSKGARYRTLFDGGAVISNPITAPAKPPRAMIGNVTDLRNGGGFSMTLEGVDRHPDGGSPITGARYSLDGGATSTWWANWNKTVTTIIATAAAVGAAQVQVQLRNVAADGTEQWSNWSEPVAVTTTLSQTQIVAAAGGTPALTSADDINIANPGGMQQGDLLLPFVVREDGGTVTQSPGFLTALPPLTDAANAHIYPFWDEVGASPPTQANFYFAGVNFQAFNGAAIVLRDPGGALEIVPNSLGTQKNGNGAQHPGARAQGVQTADAIVTIWATGLTGQNVRNFAVDGLPVNGRLDHLYSNGTLPALNQQIKVTNKGTGGPTMLIAITCHDGSAQSAQLNAQWGASQTSRSVSVALGVRVKS